MKFVCYVFAVGFMCAPTRRIFFFPRSDIDDAMVGGAFAINNNTEEEQRKKIRRGEVTSELTFTKVIDFMCSVCTCATCLCVCVCVCVHVCVFEWLDMAHI